MPHRKEGKKCFRCGKDFTNTSATFRLCTYEKGMIVHHLCCGDCWNIVNSEGE